MYRFADEVLNRVRTQSQALADLLARHDKLEPDHPERPKLAQMIELLGDEIATRRGRAFHRSAAA
jgi:hypothetical protein